MKIPLHTLVLSTLLTAVLPSCQDRPDEERSSGSSASGESAAEAAPDVAREVQRIHTFLAAGLPSYYSVGSPVVEERPVNPGLRKVIVRIPVVAEEDLFRDTGHGELVLVEQVTAKVSSDN